MSSQYFREGTGASVGIPRYLLRPIKGEKIGSDESQVAMSRSSLAVPLNDISLYEGQPVVCSHSGVTPIDNKRHIEVV